jgi:hypothetical protein
MLCKHGSCSTPAQQHCTIKGEGSYTIATAALWLLPFC